MELGDLSELEKLSEALAWLKGDRSRTTADLAAKGEGNSKMVYPSRQSRHIARSTCS